MHSTAASTATNTAPTEIISQRTHLEPAAARLDSVDLLRGAIMVVMALDHVRDYLTYYTFLPEDMANTFPALFFTRWITHFCAPLFFFLAGAGAYLSLARGKSKRELSRFLWTRGVWLMVLDPTLIYFGWTFQLKPVFLLALVIYALGLSMVLLSGLIHLRLRWLAGLSLAVIFGHNLLDGITAQQLGSFAWLWRFLHEPGFIPLTGQFGILSVYVLVPWFAVMSAGYCLGAVLRWPQERRQKWLIGMGVAAVALFLVLRITNFYGNTAGGAFVASPNFAVQPSFSMTVISLLNVQKYPPSLLFLLMTIGPGMIALALFNRFNAGAGWLARKIVIFGRVPMFYYVLHIFLIHLLTIAIALAFGQPWRWLLDGAWLTNRLPAGYGHGLGFIYLAWLGSIAVLYWPCKWYAGVKARNRQNKWLSYL